MLKLLIGIVTYKSRETIEGCLEALKLSARNIQHKIVIYDNASFDGTSHFIAQRYNDLHLIASTENHGYAKGVNEISKTYDWDYYLILNPDVFVAENAIYEAVAYMDWNREISLLGINLTDSNGEPVHSFGDLPTPGMFKYDFSGLRKVFPKPKWSANRKVTTEKEPFTVGYVTGAFMLIRADAWKSIGAMDESFFLYFEDTDWGYRLNKANRKAVIHPGLKAIHESGKSFVDDEASREYKMTCYFESAYKYLGKHFGEVERDMTYSQLLFFSMVKKGILMTYGQSQSDAVKRQEMIIRIHRDLKTRGIVN